MAAPTSSSKFMRLASTLRLLSPRSDIDSIITELLGNFSLEKIYSDADKEAYQVLVTTLLVQLNAIFRFQRLSIPSEGSPVGRYLGHLASWEVALRSIEFVLQVVVEGRESLFEAKSLRDKYLAEFLLNAIRFVALHPKIPSNQRAKDRRDRLARVHRSLECIFDSYPGHESFLLAVCKEITDSLRSDPDCFPLPAKLRAELPSLVTDHFYPLPECLQSQYISTLVAHDGFQPDWLSQFLALRDVSHYVVGASIQYAANREIQDVRLQSSSARTRNAVLTAIEHIRLPSHLPKVDLIATFSETFRTILPDTLTAERRDSGESPFDEYELDAIDMLCARLVDRHILDRASDREMVKSLAKITKKIEAFDDPSGQNRSARPRVYAINCPKSHIFGDNELNRARSEGLRLPMSMELNASQIVLPLKTKCPICGEPVSMIREIKIIRETWDLLKPLQSNADTTNVERHLHSQFHLAPPRIDPNMASQLGYGGNSMLNSPDIESSSPPYSRHPYPNPLFFNRITSPTASGFHQVLDTPRTDFSSTFMTANGSSFFDAIRSGESSSRSITGPMDPPLSPGLPLNEGSQSRLASVSTVSFEANTLSKNRSVPVMSQPDKGKSKWRKIAVSRKESTKTSGGSSSSSSMTLEAQKLEEVSLKDLMNVSKSSFKSKNSKNINVALSQNSSYALFWTQSTMNVWDIGTSPPILGRSVSPESTCVLTAVTKVHLAYIMGTSNQKLTLRIVNLIQFGVPAVEYRMPSSPWCHSICIDPKENYVVVGFDDATVRFFKTLRSEEPREDRLHSRFANHKDCKHCPPVDTISFSNDGLNLLASTRSPKNGLIQVYTWKHPFNDYAELASCRYHVPLHESEDNGITSAIFRTGQVGDENLACITTWTQSGFPILVQPQDGHRREIKTDSSGHQGKLGTRIHCAAFSPSGRELAMVNHQGHVYHVANLISSPLDVRRIATSKALTSKSNSFAMAFMSLADENYIVLAWADSTKDKETGYIKKIPIKPTPESGDGPITPLSPGTIAPISPLRPRFELPSVGREIPREPIELTAPIPEMPEPLNVVKTRLSKENPGNI